MEVPKSFVSAIQNNTPMIADGIEAVRSLEPLNCHADGGPYAATDGTAG